ncbi:MAG: hypothetical protein KJ621_13850 [Proteobacteria bacterium]|nr:hypothetical protein [Pseudomonadota bacterium]MBU1741163.1 hypothetical protein [Pseudomonadota bacterium]
MVTIGQVAGISGRMGGMAMKLGRPDLAFNQLSKNPIGGLMSSKKGGLMSIGSTKKTGLMIGQKTQTGLLSGLGMKKASTLALGTRPTGAVGMKGGLINRGV